MEANYDDFALNNSLYYQKKVSLRRKSFENEQERRPNLNLRYFRSDNKDRMGRMLSRQREISSESAKSELEIKNVLFL